MDSTMSRHGETMKHPSLGQISFLVDEICSNQWIFEHFDVGDYDEVYDRMKNITDKQRAYFWALINNQKYFSLRKLLESFGFEYIHNSSVDSTTE